MRINTIIRGLAAAAMLLVAQLGLAQNITVYGRVLNAASGEPLIGVGVVLSSGNGVVTDYDGNYTILAPSDGILTFSTVGYETVTENINGRREINVSLHEDSEFLEELVVLGYTTQKKAELSSSVVTMSGESLRDVSTSDVGNMLQGKVAGVVVMNGSGQPGSAADIRIRGTGSITAGAGPLYVVDGVAGGSFNPNDIETITVLKDASATALYGAAASGGVIVVTTKQGSSDRTEINFKANGGIKRALMGRFHAMNSEEFYDFTSSMYSAAVFSMKFSEDLLDRDFDWVNNCFKTGMVQDYFVSVSGKSGKVNYYVSMDHYNEKGTLINTSYNKTAARVNLSAPLTNHLTMQMRVNYARTNDQGASSWRTLESAYYTIPWDVPYKMGADGNWTNEFVFADGTGTRDDADMFPAADRDILGKWFTTNPSNILHSEQYNYAKSHGESITGDIQLVWTVTPWLTLTSTNRYDSSNSYYEEYTDPRTYDGISNHGILTNTDGEWYGWGTTDLAKFYKTFGVHDVNAIVGWEYSEGYSRGMGAVGNKFPVGQRSLSSSVMSEISGSDYHSRAWALLSQAQYSYLGKYIATASLRYDESYKFGPLNRGGFFPGASAAWIISKEDFMQNQGFLSFLKMRAGYGKTGNDNIDPFQYQGTYTLSAQYNGEKAAVLERLANPNLGWEEAYMTSLGFDATIKNNWNVTIDLYHTINSRILLQAPMAPSTGFFAVMKNVGKVRNMGVELAVDGSIVNKKEFGVTAGLNLGFNKNAVLELPEHQDMILNKSGVNQILREGEDVYTWYMAKWAGVNPDNGLPQWEKIADDGTITIVNTQSDATPQIVGTASPLFSGGINAGVRWKSFSLTTHGSFVVGNKVYNQVREQMDADGAQTGLNQMSIDNGLGWSRWEEPGDIATHPKVKAARADGSQLTSSRYLEDGSFFRLRNVTLSYNVPERIASKLKMSDARIYISGDNLVTLSRFSGMDPEVRLDATTWQHAGLYSHNYPVPLSVVMGIDVKF